MSATAELLTLSWSCVLRPRQFKTHDNWQDTSVKTHCHYQLVDVVSAPCHHGWISQPSIKLNQWWGLPMMRSFQTVFSLSWSHLGSWNLVSWFWGLPYYLDLGTYCLSPIPGYFSTSNNWRIVEDRRSLLTTADLTGNCISSIKWCHFQWPWITTNHDFKGMPLFNGEYLRNGIR